MIVVYFLLMMLPIVIIHELGHFYIGKWMGIRPEVFSVGFGPEIYSRQAKDGTKWRLALLPLGGYVKFSPDVNGTEFPNLDTEKQHETYRFRAKIATLLAGPFANFLFSIIVFFIYASVYGLQSNAPIIQEVSYVQSELQKGDKIVQVAGQSITDYQDFYEASLEEGAYFLALVERGGERLQVEVPNPALAIIAGLDPSMPAFKAGLEAGDRITRYGDFEVVTMADLSAAVAEMGVVPLQVEVLREDATMVFDITPEMTEIADGSSAPRIGIYNGIYEMQHAPLSISDSARYAFGATFWIITASFEGIMDLITGQVGLDALSGPVGIGQQAADSAASGFWQFVWMMGIMSSAIGFLNLLPIPVLDGGHIVFNIYEKLVGRLPPQAFVNVLFALGFGLLIGLMSLATFQDLFG